MPGSLPGPSRWKKRPGCIMVMAMYIAPTCAPACAVCLPPAPRGRVCARALRYERKMQQQASRCRWILLAGDSNTRETMEAIDRRLTGTGFRTRHAWPPRHLTRTNRLRPFNDASGAAQIGCQTKFFDQERMLVRNESRTGHCVWLSLRFLLHAGEVARLLPSTWPPRLPFARPVCEDAQWRPSRDPARFWRCAEHYGWTGNDTQSECCQRWRVLQPCVGSSPPPQQQRPQAPDFVFISSGLWRAPFDELHAALNVSRQPPLLGERCAARYASELYTFMRLRTYGVPFVWVTIWPSPQEGPLRAHQRREVACQRTLAEALSLPLLDLWSLVERGALEAQPGDIHLTAAGYDRVVALLLHTSSFGLQRLWRRRHGTAPTSDQSTVRLSGPQAQLLGADGKPLV
jgi:hypothetical protein